MALGKKTGGRTAGTPNKQTVEKQLRAAEGIQAAVETGILPLDVMLIVMRGGPDAAAISERQFQAAQAAAPYVHAKIQTLKGDPAAPLFPKMPDADIDQRIRELLAKGRSNGR